MGLLPTYSANSDIVVSIKSEKISFPSDLYKIDRTKSYYCKKGVALFKVSNGSRIDIYPYDCEDINLISEALLNFPIALCMYQRGFNVLHASAVSFAKKTVLFAGQSHSGKSTLSNYLSDNGADFITDDISIISERNGKYWIFPSYNLQKLTENYIEQVKPKTIKNRGLSLNNRERLIYKNEKSIQSKLPVDICMFLMFDDVTKISDCTNKDLIQKLMKYMYLSSDKNDYEKLLSAAKKIKFYNLHIKRGFNNLNCVVKNIEKAIS